MTLHAPRARQLVCAVALALALMAVGAAGAEAKLVKLSGSSTVTPSDGAKQFLRNAGVNVAPVGPATASGGAFTFPVFAGFGDTVSYNGILAHSGGLRFSKGKRSAVVRRPVAVRIGKTSVLLAQIPRLRGGCGHIAKATKKFLSKPRIRYIGRKTIQRYPRAARQAIRAIQAYCKQGRVIVLARMTNLGKSVDNGTATLTADLHLSAEAAKLVNRVAGRSVVRAGALLGTGTSTVTPGS
jgi:hypothetical protein